MDPVVEIKSRLPIEDLVRSYAALTKKGRNFVALCPFHNDTKPSLLVSPDKGIAYCFPCQKGGDIFSFYQAVEGVDFIQALKDLADRTGVTLPDDRVPVQKKDEKERARAALEHALNLYQKALNADEPTKSYLQKRGVTAEEIKAYEIGYAPDSYTHTYESLLKDGFSRTELSTAGLAIVKDLGEDRMYDRFRHRLMFPIRDLQGRLCGFGGRTLGGDDAKYMNSSDGPLFHKSEILFGLPQARDAMREHKRAIVVEGYFDVLACRRIGMANTVAACGTALTEQHARLLARHADSILLCMDQDLAGKQAAERAFAVLAKEGLAVYGVTLPDKDPADAVLADPDGFKALLETGGKPFLDLVLDQIAAMDVSDPRVRRDALHRVLKLLACVDSAVERAHYLGKAAAAFGSTPSAFEDDLAAQRREAERTAPVRKPEVPAVPESGLYSACELALGLMLIYPDCRSLLPELLPPLEEEPAALYAALKASAAYGHPAIEDLDLTPERRNRARILEMYCEQHGMAGWSQSIAMREVRRNCEHANKELIRTKQQDVTRRMLEAKRAGRTDEEEALRAEFNEVLRLSKPQK